MARCLIVADDLQQATAELFEGLLKRSHLCLPSDAATVIAEVGDFKRFTDRKAIGRYAGLNPRVYASGGKQRIGHIAKTGSPDLRWILQQAAWTAIRTDDAVRRVFLRVAKRSGRKAAAVAVARKMLTWMHSAVTKGEPYRTRVAA